MRRELAVLLALAALTLVVYWPVHQHEFLILDDLDYVVENHMVRQGPTLSGARWAFTTGHAANWHPLTWLSHMLDCRWFGLDAGAHLMVNVTLHALNALLLFGVLGSLGMGIWSRAVVAGLFAWHPLHVESVAWVAERKDVLSTLFWMLTMLAYLAYVRRPGWRRYLLALGLFALGLLAKPMLVTLPLILLLLDWWPLGRVAGGPGNSPGRRWSALVLEKVPFLLLTVVSSVVTFLVQRSAGAMEGAQHVALAGRIANAAVSYARYLGKAIWPADLAVFYPHPKTWPVGLIVLSVALLLVVSLFVLRLRRSRPYLIVGWLWFVGTLVPVIGLVQVGSQSMADRYTYVPLIGFFLMVVCAAADWVGGHPKRRIAAGVVAALILAACVLSTRSSLDHWKSSEHLFRHALEVTKNNVAAHQNLGDAYFRNRKLDEAAAQYGAALRLNRRLPAALTGLGAVLAAQGRPDEAIMSYEAALHLDAGSLQARNNLGVVLGQLGRLDEATVQFREAVARHPDSASAHYNLGVLLAARGENAEAIVHLRETVRLNPDHPGARSRLQQLIEAGSTRRTLQ